MDPVSIVGLVEGSIGLAVQCGSILKRLNSLAGQYKYAKLTILTMVQNLEIMQLSWDRIGVWSVDYVPKSSHDISQRLERFLETGSLVLGALEEDLRSYDVSDMSFRERSRLLWNESIMQGHQNRIRDQAQSMSLLLQAIQLPTPQATTDLLVQSKEQFMKSDESAFSIVPSRLSSRISLSTDGIGLRDSIGSHASMVYRRLSFEDALFTARVYKRNYRTPHLQSLSTRYARNKISTVSLPNDGRYYNEAIAKFKLKLQRSSEGSTTTAISSETMKPNADEEEAEGLDLKSITVKTSHSVSSEEIDTNLENRVGLSTFGWDGLYVRLVDNLEHRISLVAPDSYVKLVKACGRGDNNSVKRQLATTPVISSEDRQTSGLLGSYISGSLYFCPIHATVFNGHVEVMRTLLRRAELENDTGPVVEKAIGGTKDDSWLPLHVAAMKGNLQMVQLLLCNGASVNGKTGFGIQAIHLAARFGSVEILAALIDVGADVNCTDQEGHQPLQYVSQSHGRSRVILYLAMREEIATRCHSSDEPTALQLARYTVFNSSSLPFSLDIGSFYFEICFKARRELSQIASGRQGLGQTGSNADKMMTLHALVVDLYSGAFRDRSDFKRMLELFLDKIDLLAKDTSGATVLDRFFDLWVQIDHLVLSDLEVLFLQSLPENKDSERHVLSRKVNEMRSNATYDVRSKG